MTYFVEDLPDRVQKRPGSPARDRGRLGHSPPLDGVRAFAVAAVMAYHAGLGGLVGGFLGVDTFFVLSGFLITSLLVRERLTTGTIRLGRFWAARARRLLPALVLVLGFVGSFAYFVLPVGSYPSLRVDALFTLFYSANWHFIAQGANYFAATGPVSPLTHTWSLAVEEQFYLVWPIVVLAVLHLGTRVGSRHGRRSGLAWLLTISLLGTVGSAALMAARYSAGNETRLYYGTDTHAQSILIGAVLAVLLDMIGRRRRRGDRDGEPTTSTRRTRRGDPGWSVTSGGTRLLLGTAGVLGAVTTGWLWANVSGNGWWLYHGGFVVAGLATAAVIASAVCVETSPVARLLALPPVRFVGTISYGLYLWHFPLFLWMDHARTGLSGAPLAAARVAATGAMATASYFLVERPIRQRRFLRGWRRIALGPLSVACGVFALVIATQAVPDVGASSLAARPAAQQAGGYAHGPGPPPGPRAAPAPDDPTVLIVGDSMAETLGNGLVGQVGQHFGLNVVNAGIANCGLAVGTFEVQDDAPNPSAPPCNPGSNQPPWPAVWTSLVARYSPAVSVFVERLDVVNRLFDGSWTHIGEPAYDAYLENQLRTAVGVLTARGGRVLFLTSPYYSTGEQPDGQPWPEDDPARVDLFNSMLEQVAAADPQQVGIFDLNKLVDPNGRFQTFVDGVDVRFTDGIHWTWSGDCWLAPRLLPVVRQAAAGLPLDPAAEAAAVQPAVERFSQALCPSS